MKQKVEIYIENQRLDLFDDENIVVNSSVQNINDISKVFTDFSQSFSVPATPNNNAIFRHFYRPEINNGFDARTKKSARIEINTFPFKEGKIRLENVKIKNGKPSFYNIVFFGNLVNLTDLFGEDFLSDLDFSSFNHDFTGANVLTGLTTGLFSGSLIYPLISPFKRWFYNSSSTNHDTNEMLSNIAYHSHPTTDKHGINYTELKPALLVRDIIDVIESHYGITFSDDFFGTGALDNLFLWLSREKGYLSFIAGGGGEETLINWSTGPDNFISLATDRLTGEVLEEDDPLSANSLDEFFECSITITPEAGFESVEYDVLIRDNEKGGIIIGQNLANTGTQTIFFRIDADNTNVPPQPVDIGFYIVAAGAFSYTAENNVNFKIEAVVDGVPDNQVFNEVYTTGVLVAGGAFDLQAIMPKIKVKDFFSGIVKMFNLAIVPLTETSFFIDTINSWYASGKKYDLTKYVNTEIVDVSRSKIYGRIAFKFQEPQTLLALEFQEINKQAYGDLEVTLEDDEGKQLDGEDFEITLPFQNMIYERMTDVNDDALTNIQWGYSVDDEEDPVLIKPHIFYGVLNSTGAKTFSLIDDNDDQNEVSTAWMPSHVNNFTTKNYSTVWGAELSEYDSLLIVNSLYKLYYEDYISDTFNIKRRMFKFSARLPNKIIRDIRLNDLLIIDQRRYIINNIQNNLTTNEVELELLNDL